MGAFLLGFALATIILLIIICRENRAFKIGNLIVKDSSESWEEDRKVYRILEIGDNGYRLEQISGTKDYYSLTTLSFEYEKEYKLKR